jgi:hypothetical protein
MAIDKMKLFETTRKRWPQNFQITPTDEVPGFRAEPQLVSVFDTIDESCNPLDEWTQADNWTSVANWSFHQALWNLAKQQATEGLIRRDDVTFEMFDVWMRSNLTDESWTAERQEYEASPSRFH